MQSEMKSPTYGVKKLKKPVYCKQDRDSRIMGEIATSILDSAFGSRGDAAEPGTRVRLSDHCGALTAGNTVIRTYAIAPLQCYTGYHPVASQACPQLAEVTLVREKNGWNVESSAKHRSEEPIPADLVAWCLEYAIVAERASLLVGLIAHDPATEFLAEYKACLHHIRSAMGYGAEHRVVSVEVCTH